MNGVHDMGGMHGFGSVHPDSDEAPFKSAWEGRVFGLQLLMGVHLQSNADRFRSTLERIPPHDYLRLSYFERWLEALLMQSRAASVIDEDDVAEIRSGRLPTEREGPRAELAIPAAVIPSILQNAIVPARSETGAPRFALSDRVRARMMNPETHTRLPRYVRGKEGVIIRDHGDHTLPDSNAELAGASACRLYTVRFEARDLWGERAGPRDTVNLDLFEPYLDEL